MSSTSTMEGKDLDFGSTEFLLEHIQSILQFYDGKCCDEKNGGFFQFFKVFPKVIESYEEIDGNIKRKKYINTSN